MYVNEEGLEIILTSGTLKASVTASVNDPMENLPAVGAGTSQLKAFSVQDGGTPYFCFSDSMSNPQMWGQYAQEGRGACLVFLVPLKKSDNRYNDKADAPLAWKWDIPQKERRRIRADAKTDYWQELNYQENRVKLSKSNDKTECIFCKGIDWSYEREIRCCCNQLYADEAKNNNLLYKWPLQFLAGVILGARCKYSLPYLQRKLKCDRGKKSLGAWLKAHNVLSTPLASKLYYHDTKFEYFSAPWFDKMEGIDIDAAFAIAQTLGILTFPNQKPFKFKDFPKAHYIWPQWSQCIRKCTAGLNALPENEKQRECQLKKLCSDIIHTVKQETPLVAANGK